MGWGRLIGATAIVVFAAPTAAQQSRGVMNGSSLPAERLSYAQKKSGCYREGALSKELRGDALTQFMAACMQDEKSGAKAPAEAKPDRQRRCRDEGEFRRGLKGSQLDAFVTQCMGD